MVRLFVYPPPPTRHSRLRCVCADAHGVVSGGPSQARLYRDDSSGSDDGDTVTFIVGGSTASASADGGSVQSHGSGSGLAAGGIPIANVALHNRGGGGGSLINYASLSSLAGSGHNHSAYGADRSVSFGFGALGCG